MYVSALLVVCIMACVLHTPYYRQSFSNMSYDYLGVCTVVRNMAYVIHAPYYAFLTQKLSL